eukprot:CAMPEP_0201644868 /NCGR_PEP_ID=MMETSP0493-20130528/31027_1 /ASSEMBLY_ACC=CAM_ASM_000838 /TAXON_ID=420259 /ORGANISM="Thalassiosira gravida, Strain GMp14c1" /LENGTH=91 /DNA_ID=CAMNT_0048119677 /DNA_START=132 /DNA_END=407 /DNA_ORIENTATION=+
MTSLGFLFVVLLQENDASFEERLDDDSCPIDLYDILEDDEEGAKLSPKEKEKLEKCIVLEEKERSTLFFVEEEEEKQRQFDESGDSSVNVM